MTTRTEQPGNVLALRQASHLSGPGPGIGGLLEDLLWIGMIETSPVEDMRTGRRWRLVTVQGIIKPDLSAADPAALRKGYAETFEKVMTLLEGAGVRWSRHPELLLSGKVRDEDDGTQVFEEIQARVTIWVLT